MALAAALLLGGMSLAACGSDDNTTPSGGGSTTSSLKIGLAYDIGGRGDRSFNDAAAAGLEKAKTEFGLPAGNVKELSARSGETDADRAQRLELLAQDGYNPVLAIGFAYAKSLGTVAPKYPNVKFGIVDATVDDVKGPNVANLIFAEQEGSYLVGAAGALKSTAGHIGFVGGCDVPLIHKFEAGYKAGAKKIKPDITIDSKYLSTPQQNCSGFNDPAAGKEAAKGMYDGGADVVYQAAGGSGGGVFSAAKEASKLAIGVDSDQYNTAGAEVQGVILTSMIKHVEVAVYTFIEQVKDDQFKSGAQTFDLKVDGVGYATSGGKVDDIKSQLDDLKKQIIDGTISVPSQ